MNLYQIYIKMCLYLNIWYFVLRINSPTIFQFEQILARRVSWLVFFKNMSDRPVHLQPLTRWNKKHFCDLSLLNLFFNILISILVVFDGPSTNYFRR
jgi:hypothetical protein